MVVRALPPRSSTFTCLQKQSPDDEALKLECRRIAGGLRHFPAQAMAIVGVSPTGEPWETPQPPHLTRGDVSVDEEVEDDDEVPGYEEECHVPLLPSGQDSPDVGVSAFVFSMGSEPRLFSFLPPFAPTLPTSAHDITFVCEPVARVSMCSGIFRLFIGFFVFAVFPFGVEQNLFFSVTSFGLLWGFLGSYLIFQTIWALLSADCRFYWLKIGIPFLCEAFNGRKSLDANQ